MPLPQLRQQTEEGQKTRGGHRDKRKQDARSRHTSLITLTLTAGRMGGGQSAVRQSRIGNQVSFCELKRSAWSQCMCVCALNRLGPLESPRSAKQRRSIVHYRERETDRESCCVYKVLSVYLYAAAEAPSPLGVDTRLSQYARV